MSDIQKTCANLLLKRDKLTPTECHTAIQQIDKRLSEIKTRIESIDEGGLVRKKILETGTPSEVSDLNAELKSLLSENDSIYQQRDALASAKEKALVREAPVQARDAIKRLKVTLKEAEKTGEAHQKNVETLESLRLELLTARRIADAGHAECTALDVPTFDRLAALMCWGHATTLSRGNSDARLWRIQGELCGKETLDIQNPWKNASPSVNERRSARIVAG